MSGQRDIGCVGPGNAGCNYGFVRWNCGDCGAICCDGPAPAGTHRPRISVVPDGQTQRPPLATFPPVH